MARRLQPQAITLDLCMPDKDGLLVLAQLKADPQCASIPVLIVSGWERDAITAALGADGHLLKPVSRDMLMESLDRVTQSLSRNTLKVLVVDDEPTTLEYLTDMLEPRGFEVVQAATGAEALAQMGQVHPDVMILDLMMPGMSGFEVVEQLQHSGPNSQMPIFIYTAKDVTEPERRRLTLQGKVAGIFAKSAAPELVQELNRLTDDISSPRQGDGLATLLM
jgi:CheY-like chemotaxis protein